MQKFLNQQLRSWQAIIPVPAGNQLSVRKHAVLTTLWGDEERVNYQTQNRTQANFERILMLSKMAGTTPGQLRIWLD
jgi:hypothetical protein